MTTIEMKIEDILNILNITVEEKVVLLKELRQTCRNMSDSMAITKVITQLEVSTIAEDFHAKINAAMEEDRAQQRRVKKIKDVVTGVFGLACVGGIAYALLRK